MGDIRTVLSSWLIFDCILGAVLVLFLLKGYRERRRAINLKQQGFVSQ